jgi:SAM-dependent MidA family methyltransferase
LRARIRREGQISFREWMQAALYDEREGYYCRSDLDRQGRAGDYRTAPETSPLFAATFARYFAKLFTELGSPSSWTILEAGAGSGEFARGVLSGLKSSYPDIFHATRYALDEISPDCRTRAALNLSEFSDRVEFLTVREIAEPTANLIIFSNELIDAFPVHRVNLRHGKLRELCVGLDELDFVWLECAPSEHVVDYCQSHDLNLAENLIIEINLDAENFILRAASMIETGFLITVDYGAERNELLSDPQRSGGTLRAFHRHQMIDDVLAKPGEHDLTTTVDWTQIKEAGERVGLQTVRHESLNRFLLDEGLLEEITRLVSNHQNDAHTLHLSTSAREMIMPQGMAASFQVLVQKKSA